jgi:thiol-disulfide isomerase/thioredoxin
MRIRMNYCRRIVYLVVALSLAIFVAASHADEPKQPTLEELIKTYGPAYTIRVVDEEGKPVEGALAGEFAFCTDGKWQVNSDIPGRTDSAGDVHYPYGSNELSKRPVFAMHEGRKLAGLADAIGERSSEPVVISVTAHPARHVHGNLTCSKISSVGESLGPGTVYLSPAKEGARPIFEYDARDLHYGFLLPAGEYVLTAYCRQTTHIVLLPISVGVKSQDDIELKTIELPPTQLTMLRGKPAPPLRGVLGWKNSMGLQLTELKGRFVLLEFWGNWCGTCVVSMPKLFAISDRIPADKLVIVGIHEGMQGESDIDTAEKLDVALAAVRDNLWKGRDLPFPVALVKTEHVPFAGADDYAVSQSAADYGIWRYPTTVLIDPEGNVVGDAVEYVYSEGGIERLVKLVGAE